MAKDRMKLILEFDRVQGASYGVVKDYIETELAGAGGCRHPQDPLFDSLQNIKVTLYRQPKQKVTSHEE